jgi:GNAT superfamily N-acetyltransferase
MTTSGTTPPVQSFADLGPAGAAGAIEANDAAFLMALGVAGGGEVREDARLRWVIGGSPVDVHNCIVHAELEPEEVDGAVDEVLGRFRAHGVPGSWHVGPSSRPPDLGQRLKARGFGGGWWDVGMAADLSRLPENAPPPEGLTIARVRDRQGLDAWAQARGLDEEGALESRWVVDTYERIGLGDDVPWRHYLGLLGGRAVATGTLFLGAGVAGLYFVLTVPEARRRGIGGAITLAALHEARLMGYGVGVLGASEMGVPVYRRLGFQEYCRLTVYEWRPGSPH